MECDLFYEHLEEFSHSENMHAEDVHEDQFSNIMPRAAIRNQEDNPSGHLIGLCR
jgi:hypothetical protein